MLSERNCENRFHNICGGNPSKTADCGHIAAIDSDKCRTIIIFDQILFLRLIKQEIIHFFREFCIGKRLLLVSFAQLD